ncbi:MAG: D-alanine--D-alanine ligase [Lentisphaeria bacterium]|nr:D-alanine--D-alanine ligase [Lentisphaeria bacterium]
MVELNYKNGLVAAVVQHVRTGDILTTGEMDAAAWEQSLESGFVTLVASGGQPAAGRLRICDILMNCTLDCVLFKAEPENPAVCRTGHYSCFHRRLRHGELIPLSDTAEPAPAVVENWEELLVTAFPRLELTRNIPYRDLTTFAVGGTVPLLAEPSCEAELAALCRFLSRNGVRRLLIGGGSNLAGMDKPFDGLAIRLERGVFSSFTVCPDRTVSCGAALRLPELARQAARAGFGGLAPLSGIPGSLGGALRMNAGANGHWIGELVAQLRGCRADGSLWSADASDLTWGYRQSPIPADVIITSAVLALPPSDPETELAAIRAEAEARRRREPAARTAGCVFRNPDTGESAGRLIDQCGLKGRRQGALEVSVEHANFLLNRGGASAADLEELMTEIRAAVARNTGIYLEPELVFADPETRQRLTAAVPAPKVTVLMGGDSSERSVSLRSGAAVAAALRRAGYPVEEIDLQHCELTPEIRQATVVFPVMHGGFGEDGRLQKLLEDAGVPFVGSGSASCADVMDKIISKKIMEQHDLPTAKWAVVTRENRAFPADLRFPVMLKAPQQGSTVGIVKVESAADWETALDEVFAYDDRLLVEEFVSGIESTVAVINGTACEPIEIRPPHGIYDYDAKYLYKGGHTEYLIPAPSFSAEQKELLKKLSERFYRDFRCRDMVRVDFIIDGDGNPVILEGNALPGFTDTSLVPKAAKAAGLSFARLTAMLVKNALDRGC